MHLSKKTITLLAVSCVASCLDERARTAESAAPHRSPSPSEGEGEPDSGSDDDITSSEGEGEGQTPIEQPGCARVEPANIRFDPVAVGQNVRHAAAISNCGNVTVTVREVNLDAPDSFMLEGLPDPCSEPARTCTLNASLNPNDRLQFTVRYAPRSPGAEGGRLLIETISPNQNFEINLFARGVAPDAPGRPVAIARAGLANSGDYNEHGDPDHALVVQLDNAIQLIGSDSFDPNGGRLRFTWSVTNAPDNTRVEFEHGAHDADPTVLLPNQGGYTFMLTVENELGMSATAAAYVTARFEYGFAVDLRWAGAGALPDLDLHLLREPGRWNSEPEDCSFANPNPDWGDPGDANNPRLDRDCNGFGCASEMISIADTELGAAYRIGVNYRFASEATPIATIRVYINGVMEVEAQRRLRTPGSFWEVARFTWEGGFEHVDTIHDQMPN